MTAIILSSIAVFAVWFLGICQLRKISRRTGAEPAVSDMTDNYGDTSLLNISETFIACRKVFEQTQSHNMLKSFLANEVSLSEKQKEDLKKDLYLSFFRFRPFLSGFNGKLNETELFCFVLTLMNTDNRHCAEILNISESSVRSCKTRLRSKLEQEPLKLLNAGGN